MRRRRSRNGCRHGTLALGFFASVWSDGARSSHIRGVRTDRIRGSADRELHPRPPGLVSNPYGIAPRGLTTKRANRDRLMTCKEPGHEARVFCFQEKRNEEPYPLPPCRAGCACGESASLDSGSRHPERSETASNQRSRYATGLHPTDGGSNL